MTISRAACIAAIGLLSAPSFALSAPATPSECPDIFEALSTALTGRSVQGGVITARIERKPEGAALATSSVSVLVGGRQVALITPPATPTDPPATATITLPRARTVIVSFTWTQDPSEFVSCTGGEDTYRVVAHPSRAALRSYLAAIRPSTVEWNRVRLEARAVLNGIDTARPETFPAAAAELRRISSSDRSAKLAKRASPPPGLEAAHRGLVGTTALRLRAMRRVAALLEAAAEGRIGGDIDVGSRELQQPRRAWVRDVAIEAKFNGFALPAWAKRVGASG